MPHSKHLFHKIQKTHVQIAGVVLLILLAVLLLWNGNRNSMQAEAAMMAQVYFEGEYRIADGEWIPIVEGEHIPATKGDVTLRGNFHIATPDGEYVGNYRGEIPGALLTDHINLTIYEGGQVIHVIDMENPLFGDSGCGISWTAIILEGYSEETMEILIHNPQSFGNDTAIDEMLAGITLWAGIDFEKEAMDSGATQRNVGLLFVIVSLMLLMLSFLLMVMHMPKCANLSKDNIIIGRMAFL